MHKKAPALWKGNQTKFNKKNFNFFLFQVNYMSDFVDKLKAHGWSRSLSMSHQKSEYKEEYDTKPNIKSELDRIDGQLPYLTRPEAPMTKVIFFLNKSKFY